MPPLPCPLLSPPHLSQPLQPQPGPSLRPHSPTGHPLRPHSCHNPRCLRHQPSSRPCRLGAQDKGPLCQGLHRRAGAWASWALASSFRRGRCSAHGWPAPSPLPSWALRLGLSLAPAHSPHTATLAALCVTDRCRWACSPSFPRPGCVLSPWAGASSRFPGLASTCSKRLLPLFCCPETLARTPVWERMGQRP